MSYVLVNSMHAHVLSLLFLLGLLRSPAGPRMVWEIGLSASKITEIDPVFRLNDKNIIAVGAGGDD